MIFFFETQYAFEESNEGASQKGLAFQCGSRVSICKAANAHSTALSALTQKQASAVKNARFRARITMFFFAVSASIVE